jgi:D-alanine transaminase
LGEPLPLCYVNGEFVPLDAARISPFDRGFLFADGVYEVMPVYAGRPFRFEAHCERLARSCRELVMEDPLSRAEWRQLFATLIERNGGGDQYIYWQVTRGAERGRNHAPLPNVPRTVFAFCAPLPVLGPSVLEQGLACVSAQDTRWARCDIKSVSLLANVLLRQLAVDAGAAETILFRDGELTDASSSTVYGVINGELRAPPNSRAILPGTTRSVLEEITERAKIPYRIGRVTEADLRTADEIWVTSSTREVAPVTTLDGKPVGNGKPGALWRRAYDAFQTYKQELVGQPW